MPTYYSISFTTFLNYLLSNCTSIVIFRWACVYFLQEIIPIINWERKTFSTLMLGLIVFGSLAIFPSLLLPSTPAMWVAGMTFGYGYGFLLIMGGVAIGVSLPYFIGSLFYHRIHVWEFPIHIVSSLLVLWLLYWEVNLCFLTAGLVRKVPKESFYRQTSRRGRLF